MNEPVSTEIRGSILPSLGVDVTRVTAIEPCYMNNGHVVLFRLQLDGTTYVLKRFADMQQAVEPLAYRMLQQHGVPTLPVFGITEQAVLLEDLAASATWRLATADDIEREETGRAVAAWYSALHAAGQQMIREETPAFLTREVDAVTPESVLAIGKRLELFPIACLVVHCRTD